VCPICSSGCFEKRLPYKPQKRRSPRRWTQSTPSTKPFRTQSAENLGALGKAQVVLVRMLSTQIAHFGCRVTVGPFVSGAVPPPVETQNRVQKCK
jgi:hypothetical protein